MESMLWAAYIVTIFTTLMFSTYVVRVYTFIRYVPFIWLWTTVTTTLLASSIIRRMVTTFCVWTGLTVSIACDQHITVISMWALLFMIRTIYPNALHQVHLQLFIWSIVYRLAVFPLLLFFLEFCFAYFQCIFSFFSHLFYP